MIRRRSSVRLESDEAWRLITESHTGILVTLRSDGTPIALPMWFAVLDRHVYLQTPARSTKVARVRRDPRVAFLVEAGERWAELRAVLLTGRAEIVEDPETLARIGAAMDHKYARFRTARTAMPEATRRHYETAFVTIRVVPDGRVVSWDNRRIALKTDS
jgi:PPOX class probable F420-dependent enzyme